MLWSTQPDPLSVTPPLADHSNDSSPLQLTSDDELMDDEEDVMAVNDILGPYIGGFDDVRGSLMSETFTVLIKLGFEGRDAG